MKTIKIIDLLNKIANGEDVPKKIKFENYIYIWRNDQKDYFCKQINHSLESIIGEYLFCNLNLEVEILDEEDEFEDIEEMNLDVDCTCEWNFGEVYDTINRLIKNQKKIIERLKENE